MPSTSTKPSAKRGRPSFKPPRPSAGRSTKDKQSGRRKSAPASAIPSSSDSEDDIASPAPEEPSDPEVESSSPVARPSGTQDPPPIIPPKLITRILYHHLEKDSNRSMKVGKDANTLVGKYMDTFVREAIARAAFERSQTEEAAGTGDGFLEVEDLEKLVPQLLQDF
ncbi:MAG: hypothetical protein Q9220_004349 [cf. Caloplaca sp. 1 TL-2023]